MPDLPTRFASFIAELKRRRVVRVGLVYGAAGWAVIEAADTVFPHLTLPAWSVTFVVALVLLGLPVALLLAWAYDITPEGIRRSGPGSPDLAPSSPRPARPAGRRSAAGYVGVGIVIGLVAFAAYARFAGTGEGADAAGERAALRSIAVLPFIDMSPEGDQQYFADGLAEELLNVLARVSGLHVAARTSSFAFRGEARDARAIADALDVATVLEGSVRKWEDRIRVTAQLIDARTGYHLWSQSYDRRLDDLFAIQDQIARTIVDTLRIALGSGSSPTARPARRTDLRAHDFYLLGLHHWHRRGDEALRRAAEHFERAVAIDSTYARAYAGLAMTYAVLPLYGAYPVAEAVERGRAAALRALALDPALPEAHAALGQIAQNYEWHWAEAERRYRRALELNPNYATAHQWLGEVLAVVGRGDESVRRATQALELDPLTPVTHSVLATMLMIDGEHRAAIERFRTALELDDAFALVRQALPLAYIAVGEWDSAGAAYRLGATSPADSAAIAAWADAAAAVAAGTTPDAALRRRAVAAADVIARVLGDPTASIVPLIALGERQRALDAVALAYAERAYALPWYVAMSVYDPIRDDPGFQRIVRAMGLSPRMRPADR